MAYYSNPNHSAPFNNNVDTKFSLSRNGGLDRTITLARTVQISGSVMNRKHPLSLYRTLQANPGYVLLLPGPDGSFSTEAAVDHGKVATLLLPWLKYKAAVAIEVLQREFELRLPIRIDYGFNPHMGSQNIVSYQAAFRISIADIARFLCSFGFSEQHNMITIADVHAEIERHLETLTSTCVTTHGTIDQRAIRGMFNAYGLYIHGNPAILAYESELEKHMGRIYEQIHLAREAEARQAMKEKMELRNKALEQLPALHKELLINGISAEKSSEIIKSYREEIDRCMEDIDHMHENLFLLAQARLDELVEASIAQGCPALPSGGQNRLPAPGQQHSHSNHPGDGHQPRLLPNSQNGGYPHSNERHNPISNASRNNGWRDQNSYPPRNNNGWQSQTGGYPHSNDRYNPTGNAPRNNNRYNPTGSDTSANSQGGYDIRRHPGFRRP